MSEDGDRLPDTPEEESAETPDVLGKPWVKRALLGVAGVLVIVLALMGAGAWYVSTAGFQQKVRLKVIALLEQATGGRVELQGFRFSLWRLDAVADHLVIHGLEGPKEAPYLQADRIEIRLQIRSFLSQTAGAHLVNDNSIASHIALNLLQVDRPQAHIIIYPDGSTNQPTTKTKSASNKPVADTLLDLEAETVNVNNGVVLLNDRAIPFNLDARELNVNVEYQMVGDQYAIHVGLNDLRTTMQKKPTVQSRLAADVTFARHGMEIKRFEFDTGKKSKLIATGSVKDFNHPAWQVAANGTVELKQVTAISGFEELTGGSVDLKLEGRSCSDAEIAAWRAKPAAVRVAGGKDANTFRWGHCDEAYAITGVTRISKAGYTDPDVRVHDVDGGAKVRATPSVLQLAEMEAYLPGGGKVTGSMRIDNWLGPVDDSAHRVNVKRKTATGREAIVPIEPGGVHAYIDAQTTAVPLRTIMDVTAPKDYGDLGFDTAETGPVHVEWGDGGATVIVNGNLTFAPTGVHRAGALSDVPVTGTVLAQYRGGNETVAIASIHVRTPATTLDASGILGVDTGDPLTQLKADVTTHDLGEFNQLFRTLGLEYNGRRGMDAVPLKLHGDVHFVGTASGPVEMLDIKGHVVGQNLELTLPESASAPPPPPPARPITERLANYFRRENTPKVVVAPPPVATRHIMIDSVVGDAEYTPASLQITSSTVKRGTVTLSATGKALPHRVVGRHGVVDYNWDDATVVDATLDMPQAQAPDLLDVIGMEVPLSGKVQMHAHVTGTLGNLDGNGSVLLTNGVLYGEPYQRAEFALSAAGQDIRVTRAALLMHGAQITGAGDYDLKSEHLRAHVQANDLKLAQFQTIATAKYAVDGNLTLLADADGTLQQPGLHATVHLTNLTLDGAAMGSLTAEAHSQGSTVLFAANSEQSSGRLYLGGKTELTGNYPTEAKLEMSSVNIENLLRLYAPKGITGHSSIGGTVTLSGPLATPQQLNGTAELSQFDVNLSGIELQAPQPIRASLENGLLKIDQAHITGADTDLKATGSAQIFNTGGTPGRLRMRAEGNVNMKLAQTVDPDIISSGRVDLSMTAGGTVSAPSLSGKVQFHDVAVALEDVPNGLSQMNGTLVFTENRLQVQTLTAMTGGGQLKIGGFMTYKNGFFADLTATGDTVRVRYLGLSSTANASLRLQGSTSSALLSGNILITRFGIGPDFDFAAFAGPATLPTPPDPNAPSSHIRLDVHVTSSPQLDFQNSYAKLAGMVDLNIGGTISVPTVLGRITVTDGSAKFAGQTYELQRGNIYFTNPVRIDPQIDVDATTRVENYDVTVGVHGTSSNLKPTYRSEPPLSETDIFALLALGRTQEEAQIYNQQQTAQGVDPTTSALLGGALNATVSNRVEKLFGVGSVKIDPSFVGTLGTSSARITVEQQLSRNLTVTYATNVNQTAEQLIQLQLNLTDNVSVVAARDETGVFSTVLKIRHRYR
ncbi:MAG: translocation/assembly module TamB domain-containing protein [Acidobacteriaceae bacterium]|jgi:translocation and assembly module TamB|nr:translocation/assembly module TamB domain-containing protein [Acidobacteriaceae bacterium]